MLNRDWFGRRGATALMQLTNRALQSRRMHEDSTWQDDK